MKLEILGLDHTKTDLEVNNFDEIIYILKESQLHVTNKTALDVNNHFNYNCPLCYFAHDTKELKESEEAYSYVIIQEKLEDGNTKFSLNLKQSDKYIFCIMEAINQQMKY